MKSRRPKVARHDGIVTTYTGRLIFNDLVMLGTRDSSIYPDHMHPAPSRIFRTCLTNRCAGISRPTVEEWNRNFQQLHGISARIVLLMATSRCPPIPTHAFDETFDWPTFQEALDKEVGRILTMKRARRDAELAVFLLAP